MNKDEALNIALEALTNAYWPTESDLMPAHNIKECAEAITAIKESLAQPEQEPVAWKDMAFARLGVVRDKMHHANVETIQRFLDGDYTTPPQRTWVSPTDKEIEAIWEVAMFANYGVGAELSNQPFVHYARAIEAKLKAKNSL